MHARGRAGTAPRDPPPTPGRRRPSSRRSGAPAPIRHPTRNPNRLRAAGAAQRLPGGHNRGRDHLLPPSVHLLLGHVLERACAPQHVRPAGLAALVLQVRLGRLLAARLHLRFHLQLRMYSRRLKTRMRSCLRRASRQCACVLMGGRRAAAPAPAQAGQPVAAHCQAPRLRSLLATVRRCAELLQRRRRLKQASLLWHIARRRLLPLCAVPAAKQLRG